MTTGIAATGGAVIRRQPTGAVWGGFASSLTAPVVIPAGSVQPRPTVPVPRRYPSRGLWQGQSTPQPHLPGTVQPRATVPVPRRYPSRAAWSAVLGPANAHGPSGTVQPRACVPVPRRTAARAAWGRALGTANAHGPSGTVQPHLVIARRAAARGCRLGTVVTTANAPPAAAPAPKQPPPVPRRTAARVFWRGTLTPGTVPPADIRFTLGTPYWRWTAGTPGFRWAAGTLQA